MNYSNEHSSVGVRSRVLIVDDDEDLRDIVALTLSSCGYACEVAPGAAAAEELLDQQPFDVVISDLRMRGMSGLELLDRVKRSHPELPFIIMTGSTRPHESTDAAGRGAFEYLVKPCDTEEVQRAVANAIRRDDSSSARA